ncbi:hypothetical protein F4679DRAFT_551063 [Xylaria curta]|nr:hypothetical protein F4679DRAFT_551063 [Xylaria curta]
MQISTLFLATAFLSLGSASIIPSVHGRALASAYMRRAALDISATLEPQRFADVQVDRRKAFGEGL